MGRFDCMHARSNHDATGIASKAAPSTYLRRMYYDTILHDPAALRHLASLVKVDRIVIGTDDSFPPADHDPLGTLRGAGFSDEEIHRIAELNPRELFRFG
jgi:aminocarboxymuconate-semialdehyde decarboxylase